MKIHIPLFICLAFLFGCGEEDSGPCGPYSNDINGRYRRVSDPDRYLTLTKQGNDVLSAHFEATVAGEELEGTCTVQLNDADCAIGLFTFDCGVEFFGFSQPEGVEFEETLTIESSTVIYFDEHEYRRVQ